MSTASSEEPGAQQSVPKSSRVCLNCRRKKKRCDKALPSCGRCTYSLELCQHENDGQARSAGTSGTVRFESLLSPIGGHMSPFMNSPVLESASMAGSESSGALSPAVFGSLDSGETIHRYAMRCLRNVLGSREGVESVVQYYFASINTWFTVFEQTSFENDLESMWTNPSADIGLAILCMSLVARSPKQGLPTHGMNDGLYLTTKTLLSLVSSKAPLSMLQLQAQILIALYEFAHALPQQAYMSVGACCHMTRAFGWHGTPFWAEERQSMAPRDLKMCSLLWWAVVFIDCLLYVGYPDQKYPLHTSEMEFPVPFPETFDQYLGGPMAIHPQFEYLDGGLDKIETMIWPEATSAWYLRNVLHQLSSSNLPTSAERDIRSEAITAHTLSLMNGQYKHGTRSAAVGLNFIALMKLNQPYLMAGRNALETRHDLDPRPMETVKSVINSIYAGAQTLTEHNGGHVMNGNVAPGGAFSLYYAALLLISHGDNVLQDPAWQLKVEGLKRGLEVYSRRWKLAGK